MLADRIKALREQLDLSQEELAQTAGLSVYTVSRLERGERVDPSVFTVDALAQELGTTIDELLHGLRSDPKSVRQETSARSKRSTATDVGRPRVKDDPLLPTPTSTAKTRRQRSQ